MGGGSGWDDRSESEPSAYIDRLDVEKKGRVKSPG